jgi:gamma-glutamylputrescine oxidase
MNFQRIDQELTRHSYYAATAAPGPGYAPLQGEARCDVAIVGGGLAGLSAAVDLAQRGFSVTLLEAREIGFGASGRNGGQAIHGLACDQQLVEQQLGLEEAKRVWAMSIEALGLLRQRIAQFDIACDWRDGFLGVATSPRKARELAAWVQRMAEVYGDRMQGLDAAALPACIASPRYHGGVFDPRSGHLHPLKYTRALARAAAGLGVTLHEHSAVTALEPGAQPCLRTATGRLQARQVLLAGNVYLRGLVPRLQRRIMPVGTYIVASEPLGEERARALIPCGAAVCDTNFVLDYFRCSADHRLLYGGRVSYSTATPMNLAGSMQERMVHTFPQLAGVKVSHAWGGFVDISMSRAPDFGRLPAEGHAPNVYYLQVFARLKHRPFPGGDLLRMPALVLGMAWYRLRDALA